MDEPLICSTGGVPYNKSHLDAKDAEIARLAAENERLTEQWAEVKAEVTELRLTNERLEQELAEAKADLASGFMAGAYARLKNLQKAEDKLIKEDLMASQCKQWLLVILDCVDYTRGSCRLNEMIGAVLPSEIIEQARQACKDEIDDHHSISNTKL